MARIDYPPTQTSFGRSWLCWHFFVGCLFLRINFQTVGLTHSSAVIFRAILFTFEATSIKLIRFLCQSLKNKFCWGVIWHQYCYALEWLVEGKPCREFDWSAFKLFVPRKDGSGLMWFQFYYYGRFRPLYWKMNKRKKSLNK
jgi:hypothetical protein